MEITEYMLKLFIDMSETNIYTLSKKYYMEFSRTIKITDRYRIRAITKKNI